MIGKARTGNENASRFTGDERGISFNLGYTVTVGITAVLLIGVISGVGVVLESQQDRAVSHQVDVIADQVASGVMATDRLGNVGEGGNATVTRELPSEVVGTPYFIRLVDRPGGSFVVVDAVNAEYEAVVPVNIGGNVRETTVIGGDTIEIVHTLDPDTGERTVHLQPQDKSVIASEIEDSEFFDVTIEQISPDPAQEGDVVTVESRVTNTGDEPGTQTVTLDIVGFGEVDSESVTLDPSENEVVTLQWDNAESTGDFEGAVVETNDASSFQTFQVEPDQNEPRVSVHEFSVSDKTDEDEFTVDITVEEEHDVTANDVDLNLRVDDPSGTTVYDEMVSLGDLNGEIRTVTFGDDHGTPTLGEFTADEDAYTITARVDTSNANSDSETGSFRVSHANEPAQFEVDVVSSPSEVAHDEDYTVFVDVTNTGEQSGAQDIDLLIDGDGVVDSESLNVDGGETESITLTWTSDDHSPGDYTGSVSSSDSSEPISVTVNDDSPDRPEFSSITVTDDSTDWPPGHAGVEYNAAFSVDDPDNRFERVEVEFVNHDNSGANEVFTVGDETGDVTHNDGSADFGDEYTITFRLYDVDGEVEVERVVIDDTADGDDP